MGNMETREIVVNSVLVILQQAMTVIQLQMIEDAVRVSLKGYKLEKECTELATGMDDNRYILEVFRANKRLEGCKEGSVIQYWRHNKNFLEDVNKNYRDITKDDVKLYLARYSVGRKQNTIANMKRYLSTFYTWLHEEGMIQKNPVKSIKGIRPEVTETKYFTPEEEIALRDVADRRSVRDRAIIDFLLSTGVRVGEIAQLNRQDVDLIKGSVTFKGEKRDHYRTVYLDARAKRHLCDYIKSREDNLEPLFVTKKKYRDEDGILRYKRMASSAYESLTKSIGAAAGIRDKKCTVHIFRKTFATRMAERDCPMEIVQELLGHADVSTTIKYYVGKSKVRAKREFDRCMVSA